MTKMYFVDVYDTFYNNSLKNFENVGLEQRITPQSQLARTYWIIHAFLVPSH